MMFISSATFIYPPKILCLCNVEGWSTTLFHPLILPSTVLLCVMFVLLVIIISDIRMSHGTSGSTVITSTKTEAHNLNATHTSAVTREGPSPAHIHATTLENRHK